MAEHVLAFDLGTGSCKASLWTANGDCVAQRSRAYPTSFTPEGGQEQRPEDWWVSITTTTHDLLEASGRSPADVAAIAVSGHSLGAILLDDSGHTLLGTTPIWSDSRGSQGAQEFFARRPEPEWYELTGNGFPPPLYPVFKLKWFAENEPEAWRRTAWVVGTKDWVVQRLTGVVVTDPSYASGFGAFGLLAGSYDSRILAEAGVDLRLLPPIVPSSSIVGELTRQAADALGLRAGTPVAGGGVDNSCMAAGSGNVRAGRTFLSLGSSSWAVATRERPILDLETRPYTFVSLAPGLFDSALSTFTAGTALKWVRETMLGRINDAGLVHLAEGSEPGARGLTFLPMLAGGSALEGGPGVRGALLGLDAIHTQADIARAAVEGSAFALARAEARLGALGGSPDRIVVTGGAAQNPWVRALYADVLGRPIVATGVDQQAAALGAASTAFVALGQWDEISDLERAHQIVAEHRPDPGNHVRYQEALERFERLLLAHARDA